MTRDQLLEAVEAWLAGSAPRDPNETLRAMHEFLLLPVPLPPKSLTTALQDRINEFPKQSPRHKQEFFERVVGAEPLRYGQVWVTKPHVLRKGWIKITSFNKRNIFGDDETGLQQEYSYEGFQDLWVLKEQTAYELPDNAEAIQKAYELGLQDAADIVDKTVNNINKNWELAHRFRVKKSATPVIVESTDRPVHLFMDTGEVIHHWRKKP